MKFSITFVRTEKLDIVAKILNHIPMPFDLTITMRLDSHKSFLAFILIARRLKTKANRGPNGNTDTNRVTKPNCKTKYK